MNIKLNLNRLIIYIIIFAVGFFISNIFSINIPFLGNNNIERKNKEIEKLEKVNENLREENTKIEKKNKSFKDSLEIVNKRIDSLYKKNAKRKDYIDSLKLEINSLNKKIGVSDENINKINDLQNEEINYYDTANVHKYFDFLSRYFKTNE